MSVFLISLVLFPVFVFLFKVPFIPISLDFDWIEVLCSTFLQASLSTFFSIGFGIFGALGLCLLTKKRINPLGLELFCLLPALLPPLIPVLAWINVSEFFFKFPFSFYSVLWVHVWMNTGLVSVFLFRLFCSERDNLSYWAFLHGLSLLAFLKKMLFFEWRKDLLIIFLLVFSFCFTSFSVPLLVGGKTGKTLEVFIAEKLKNPSHWPEALFLFFVETVFIFLFFILLYSKERGSLKTEKKTFYGQVSYKDIPIFFKAPETIKSFWPGLVKKNSFFIFCLLPVFPSLLIFLGLGDVFASPSLWQDLFSIKEAVLKALGRSLLVAVGTGVFVFCLLSAVAFCLRDLFLRRFLIAYSGASTAFMGFAFLLIGSDSPFEVCLKWSLGLSLLFLPALYRLMGESLLRRLKSQIQVSDLMGAGRLMSFIRIIFPQVSYGFLFLAGVSAFWACGDFAYSSIVAGSEVHLALLIKDLFSSYRLELSTALTWLLIFTGMFCFSLFAGGAFFCHKKLGLRKKSF